MNPKAIKKYPIALLSSIFLTVIPLLFSSAITVLVIQNQGKIEQFGFNEWLIITLICCITSAIAVTPPTVLALIFGYFLGWNAILPVFVLNMVAIFLIILIARKFDKEKLENYLAKNPKAQHILQNLYKDEFKLILFAKLSPVIPFALINLVFAFSDAKLKNILWGGFLGMIPRTVLAVWTGMQAKEISTLLANPNEENANKIILILLIISSLLGIFWVVNKAIKRES